DISPETPEKPALDVIRCVPQDQADAIAHAANFPPVLTEAILSFILSSCGRLARGQIRDHFTMLIHPSGRIDDQNACYETVCQEFIRIKEAVTRPKFFQDFEKMARE